METPSWLKQLAFVAICLVVPIFWGWLVNWLFVRWDQRRRDGKRPHSSSTDEVDDETFIDYQI
jgi:hypothetical protein